MNRESANNGLYQLLLPLLAISVVSPALAQVPVDDGGYPIAAIDANGDYEAASEPVGAAHTSAELQQLVGPIALYPDDLLAIVLPASTYPLQIVQAARFLEAFEQDSTLKPDEDWDESVVALLNYPEVLELMNEDIDWTWKLGEAVIEQQEQVVAAVESFRDRAYAAGNLQSDEHQTVSNDGGIIEIVPIDDEIIYVPYYEPERVLVSQAYPAYHYYPRPYPVYYYPYPARYSFSSGFFWGVTTAFGISWASDHLHVHHHSYWGHPYYGRTYYGHYYRRPTINIYNSYYVNHRSRYVSNHHRDGDYWQPRTYGGPRPGYHRSRTQRSRTVAVTQTTRNSAPRNNVRVQNRRDSANAQNRDQIQFRDRDERVAATTRRSRETGRRGATVRQARFAADPISTTRAPRNNRPDTVNRRTVATGEPNNRRIAAADNARRSVTRRNTVARNDLAQRPQVKRMAAASNASRTPARSNRESRPAKSAPVQRTQRENRGNSTKDSKQATTRSSSRSRNERRRQRH